jgi:ketosteroid isomerase-like protein
MSIRPIQRLASPRPPKSLVVVCLLHLAAVASGCAATSPGRGASVVSEGSVPAVDQTSDVTCNPYHAVVRSKILAAFRGLTRHDPVPALAVMAEDVTYTFDGDHALGGTRVSRRGVARWFERLFRLLPGPFVVRSVEVTGWPWSTAVVTRLEHEITLPDGATYWAPAIQTLELRWGSAVRIRTRVLDEAKLVGTLEAMAASGNPEAKAAQILE